MCFANFEEDFGDIFLSLFAYGADDDFDLLLGLLRQTFISRHEDAVRWTGGGDEPVLSPQLRHEFFYLYRALAEISEHSGRGTQHKPPS